MRSASLRSLAVVVLGVLASPVAAQESEDVRLRAFDLQLVQPTTSPGATFLIESPRALRHSTFSFGLAVQGALNPMVRAGDPAVPLVEGLLQGDLVGAVGLFELIELGVAIPVVGGWALDSASGGAPDLLGGSGTAFALGAGDLRVGVKVPLVLGDFSLAAHVQFALPPCAGGSCASIPWFVSTRYWTLNPRLVATGRLGAFTVAGELGYRMRQRRQVEDFVQDDQVYLGVGGQLELSSDVSLVADAQLRIGLGNAFLGHSMNASDFPAEVDLGARFFPAGQVSLDVLVGRGLGVAPSAPDFRALASVRLRVDTSSCAYGPEDSDGFMDGDFCLDPDNDGDGVEDTADRCPNDVEDVDGFLDADGCPEADNDADGILDHADACATESEDDDEYRDEDGCPEPDNDEDGVLDGDDACVMDPEDRDDFQDDDGCPEPGPRAIPVTISDTRILIGETIYFEFDTEVIRPVSFPLLDQVAEVIGTLSPDLRIRVDGHTDNQGSRAYNVDLSFRRARAVVEYLTSRGVPRERLDYRGYGAEHPMAPNDSPQGQALNRRVEFMILRAGERAAPTRPRRP